MLLTSGQISMGISSGIVFIFTSLLFLSGYILQQRTVRSLQAIINPPAIPKPSIINAPEPLYDLEDDDDGSTDWTEVAYVHLITDPSNVCDSIMQFAELERQRNRAERVLMYPRHWDRRAGKERQMRDARLNTAKRLLLRAEKAYGVTLMPTDPLFEDMNVQDPRSYSLPLYFSLPYNRILTLSMPSIILSARKLNDAVLAESSSPLATMTDFHIIQPSPSEYSRISTAYSHLSPLTSKNEAELLNFLYPNATQNPSNDLVVHTGNFGESTDITAAAYVHFDDTGIAPAYDVPRSDMFINRPSGMAGKLWDSLWERYRDERKQVCGLDLLPWHLAAQESPASLEDGVDASMPAEEEL